MDDELPASQQLKSSKKRKRKSSTIRKQSTNDGSPDLDTLLQAQIARDELAGPLERAHPIGIQQKKEEIPRGSFQSLVPDANPPQSLHAANPNTSSISPRHRSTDLLPSQDNLTDPVKKFRAVYSSVKGNFTPINAAHPDWSYDIGTRSIPLIETLPKEKQRQIYAIISGIQGGIYHLQEQLNALQELLCIDLDRPISG